MSNLIVPLNQEVIAAFEAAASLSRANSALPPGAQITISLPITTNPPNARWTLTKNGEISFTQADLVVVPNRVIGELRRHGIFSLQQGIHRIYLDGREATKVAVSPLDSHNWHYKEEASTSNNIWPVPDSTIITRDFAITTTGDPQSRTVTLIQLRLGALTGNHTDWVERRPERIDCGVIDDL